MTYKIGDLVSICGPSWEDECHGVLLVIIDSAPFKKYKVLWLDDNSIGSTSLTYENSKLESGVK